MNQGLIQVYTGDGKGKTTAAIGLAVRAWGRGWRVIIYQLLKGPNGSGEQITLAQLSPELPIKPLGTGQFIINRQPTAEEIALANQGWQEIQQAIFGREYDLIIIDELSHALNKGLLAVEDVVNTLQAKPDSVEVVLTGRNMPESILALADLVTELKMVKHPYQKGIGAREGIEY